MPRRRPEELRAALARVLSAPFPEALNLPAPPPAPPVRPAPPEAPPLLRITDLPGALRVRDIPGALAQLQGAGVLRSGR